MRCRPTTQRSSRRLPPPAATVVPRWLYVALACNLAAPVVAAVLWGWLPTAAECLMVGMIPGLLATAGVAEWRRRIRVRRYGQNRCTACGFSLRESAERCGECGTPLPTDHRRLSEAVEALQRMR